MNKAIETVIQTRRSVLELVKDLSIDQLNKIPPGFNNNIAWHLGHVIASQQGVCYKRAGIDMRIPDSFFMTFKPDSKPERFITQGEIDEIKVLLFSTIDQLVTDYQNNLVTTYPAWTTRYGVAITNYDEGIGFLPFHEGLHFGYVMALKRAVLAS